MRAHDSEEKMRTRPERMTPSPGYFLVKLYTPDGQLRRHPSEPTTRASAQIALHWDTYYRRVWDGVGLEGLHGMRASEALPRLEYAVRKLGKQSGEDLLAHRQLSQEEQADNCLAMFVNWCRWFLMIGLKCLQAQLQHGMLPRKRAKDDSRPGF